jgi:hypothetical protein
MTLVKSLRYVPYTGIYHFSMVADPGFAWIRILLTAGCGSGSWCSSFFLNAGSDPQYSI